MSDRGFHRIEDDIADTWLEDWAGAGVAELEAYLAKHADFLRFLEERDSAQGAALFARCSDTTRPGERGLRNAPS